MKESGREPSGQSADPLHPIGVVARRTGISIHVLRAWERRYGVVEPLRTPGGQRLYSDVDIRRLRLLREVTDVGRPISQVAQLTEAELAALAVADRQDRPAVPDDRAAEYLRACLAAGERMDGVAVHGMLTRAAMALRPREFMADVLLPLLREVGARWHGGELGPAQEHVISQAARGVLFRILETYDVAPDAPVFVSTTPSGELHEIGALAASVTALEEGWRVVYLGPSLPASEVLRAVRQVHAAAVALSAVVVASDDSVVSEASILAAGLSADVELLMGGAGAEARAEELEEAGARVLTDLNELRAVLRGIRPVQFLA